MACESLGNHPDDTFRLKVVQLEELLEIRHCVFVMGPPGAGTITFYPWSRLNLVRENTVLEDAW